MWPFAAWGTWPWSCTKTAKPLGCPGPFDHLALDVTDVEGAYALVQQLGYPVVSQGIESLPFWERGVRYFTILGPNGERVEFNQYL